MPGKALIYQLERARRATNQQFSSDVGASRKRCERLLDFVREAWPVLLPDTPYVYGWHIGLLARHLEAVTHGEMLAKGLDNRLLMNVPPGSMKSLLVSVFWPAWEWTLYPHLQYITASFRDDFCKRDSRRFSALVRSDWYQQRWPVDITSLGDMRTANARGGWREALPFGSLTGGRADRLILDDPHSVDGAESDADRERATIRFRESASLRLNDPAASAIVIIMQRLHQQDISGVIEQYKLGYVHVMLPMRFEPERACETPFGKDVRTTEGELLFPERFSEAVVERDELTISAHAVASQFQQRPTPRGGLTFKRHWFKMCDAAPEACRWVRGWDLAATEKDKGAFTVGVLVGRHKPTRQFYIKNVVRARIGNPEAMIVNTAAQDGKFVEIDLPQDPGAAGKIQARSLIAALVGYNAHCSPESGDKVQRSMPVAAQAEAGNVSIVRGEWNNAFLDEIEMFPAGYKDQVDALSRAFSRFTGGQGDGIAGPIIISSKRTYVGDHPEN